MTTSLTKNNKTDDDGTDNKAANDFAIIICLLPTIMMHQAVCYLLVSFSYL